MEEKSVFSKIIDGELPAHKIYEDELTIVIVALHQTALGKVLVIPKKQVDQFYDLPDEDYFALMSTVKKVAKRIKEVIKPKRVGLHIEGLGVPHVHVHVVAFDNQAQYLEVEDESEPVDQEALAVLAQKLSF